jgi:hypothetical protein
VAIETRADKKSWMGLPVYIGAAILLVGGVLLAYLALESRRPAAELELTPEAKAYVRNLQLSDVTMQASQSLFNQVVVEIQGKIANAGDRAVETVEIYCVFHDSYGQTVLRKRVPIVGGPTGAKAGPLKPGETRSFRMPFDELPESWNHAMPNLVIAGIKFS